MEIQDIVSKQKAIAVDIAKMVTERTNLTQSSIMMKQQNESLLKRIGDLEIDIGKKLEILKELVQQFNSRAQKKNMKLVPSSAKNAKGVDYQLGFHPQSPDNTIEQIKKSLKVRQYLFSILHSSFKLSLVELN